MHVLQLVTNDAAHDPRVVNTTMWLREMGHKVTVLDCPPWPLRTGLKLLKYQLWAYWQARRLSYNAVYCNDFDTLPAGLALKGSRPLIYDIHDIYPFILARQFPKWVWKTVAWIEKKLIPKLSLIITASENFRNYYGAGTVIHNVKRPVPVYVPSTHPVSDFQLCYWGTLAKNRFLEELIESAKTLDIGLVIGGTGPWEEKIKKLCDHPNIVFTGQIPMDQIVVSMVFCDVTVCMFSPQDLNSCRAIANKQFEAMCAGRPILCTQNTASGDMTDRLGVGLTCPYDKKEFQETVMKLKDSALQERLGRKAHWTAQRWNIDTEGKIFKEAVSCLLS